MGKLLRLPVAHNPNTRVSQTNNAPGSSGIVGIGIVGVMVVGRTTAASDKDARYVNCFKQTVDGREYLVKRSGLATSSTPQAGSIGTAIMVWSGNASSTTVISAFGGTNSSIYDGTTRLVTDNADTTVITGKATAITETTVSGTATIYITSTDNTAWYYQPSGTVTKITDAQFPGNNSKTLAGFGAHLDGYTFQMDTTGAIWNSDLNSITSWTATGYISADIYPDKGIGCVRFKQYIVGFGTQSMEFFYNAGNATGSPLTRIPNMAQKIGAVHADAITVISDNIFFAGSTPQGGLSIYQYDGTLSRISPPTMDGLLLLAGAGGVKLTSLRDYGLSFIVVKAGSVQYAYCVEEKFWFRWAWDLGFVRFAGLSTGTSQVSYGVSETSTAGKIFVINPQTKTYQDNGVTFSAVAQLPTIDPGAGAFVAYEEAQIKADVETSTSNLSLSWTDDDYETWSTARTLDLSESIPKTSRLGGTRHPRAFLLSHTTNTPMRLEELRVRVSVGAR